MQIFITKIFRAPFRPQKNFRAPFLPWKLRVNPIEKHANSIFNGNLKSVVIFFQGPPYKGKKNLRAPLFASGPPYKCLWTVPKGPGTNGGNLKGNIILEMIFLGREGHANFKFPGPHITYVLPGGGPLVSEVGYHPRKGLSKHTLNTYFSGMKTDPKYAFLHAFFLIWASCPFKICQYDQKHTLFF